MAGILVVLHPMNTTNVWWRYRCVRAQHEIAMAESGSFEAFAAVSSNVRCAIVPLPPILAGDYLRSLSAAATADPRERIEVDFLLLLVTYVRPGFRYRLGPVDAPHHRMCACTPAINPTNNAAPIGPDQIGDRDALTLIIFHCLLTSCTVALNLRHGVIRRSLAPQAARGGCWLTALP